MSLAVKYRPQSFKDVVGQDIAVKIIQNSLSRNGSKIYLLSGTRGSGKTTLARLIAKSLNIQPYDFQELDGASFNKAEDIDTFVLPFITSFPRGDYRLLIVDECHQLSKAAWSKLLKPLEELSESVIICFCTTEISKILPTILSRCIDIRLPAISSKLIVPRLQLVVRSENIVCTDEALSLIARLSEGSMREALTLLESCRLFTDKIDATAVWYCINQFSDSDRASFIRALQEQNLVKLNDFLDNIADMLYFFDLITQFIVSEILLISKSESVYFTISDLPYLQNLLKKMLNVQLRFSGCSLNLNTIIRAFFTVMCRQESIVVTDTVKLFPVHKILNASGFVRVW